MDAEIVERLRRPSDRKLVQEIRIIQHILQQHTQENGRAKLVIVKRVVSISE